MEGVKNRRKILIGNPERKRLLRRPRRRWEDNIRMNLSEICWERVDWMHLAQDRVQWWTFVDTLMDLRDQ